MSNVMIEAFKKLLDSSEVQNRWNRDTLDGILTMHIMFVEFAVARLAYRPVPCTLLKTLASLFNVGSNYMFKTKMRPFERERYV
jgi:hypothetical protein